MKCHLIYECILLYSPGLSHMGGVGVVSCLEAGLEWEGAASVLGAADGGVSGL